VIGNRKQICCSNYVAQFLISTVQSDSVFKTNFDNDDDFPAGCPRVVGDEDENLDGDDFEDEFPVKNHHDDLDLNRDANHVVISFNDIKAYS